MQTFCEGSFQFKTLVDPFATYQFKELPRSPTVRIIPGAPARRVLIAPSRVQVGQPFSVYLKKEDVWGNPCGVPAAHRHRGFARPGIYRCQVSGTTSNPIAVVEGDDRMRPFWADLHGQSEETIGTKSIEDYFRFARDMARLDIAGHQGNDFQITDEFWQRIKTVSRQVTRAGRFVAFPGYEWSGNTPLGGDRNVYFRRDTGVITRSSHELLPGQRSRYPLSPTAAALFRNLRRQREAGPFSVAHVGGRYADLATHDSELEWAVEVHSAWGTFEWLVDDALCRGRARMVDWSGALRLENNSIRGVTPVQFWNPARRLRQVGPRQVEWDSVTTGGAAGCILELEQPHAGRLVIETRQGRATFPIRGIGLNRQVRSFGGLDKQISVHRLPDRLEQLDFHYCLPLAGLRRGDNPLFVRVTQRDEHRAWSSPIYLVT